jgi:hypothetical protein
LRNKRGTRLDRAVDGVEHACVPGTLDAVAGDRPVGERPAAMSASTLEYVSPACTTDHDELESVERGADRLVVDHVRDLYQSPPLAVLDARALSAGPIATIHLGSRPIQLPRMVEPRLMSAVEYLIDIDGRVSDRMLGPYLDEFTITPHATWHDTGRPTPRHPSLGNGSPSTSG